MIQLTEEQSKRLKQIRERLTAHRTEIDKYRSLKWAEGDALRYYKAPDDVEFLLSLYDGDSQAAGTGWLREEICTTYANAMRQACVCELYKMKAEDEAAGTYPQGRGIYAEIAKRLESLTP